MEGGRNDVLVSVNFCFFDSRFRGKMGGVWLWQYDEQWWWMVGFVRCCWCFDFRSAVRDREFGEWVARSLMPVVLFVIVSNCFFHSRPGKERSSASQEKAHSNRQR